MKEQATTLKMKPQNKVKLATHIQSRVGENQVTIDYQMPFLKLGIWNLPSLNFFLLTLSNLKMAPPSK